MPPILIFCCESLKAAEVRNCESMWSDLAVETQVVLVQLLTD
jgi:hypothetical protein